MPPQLTLRARYHCYDMRFADINRHHVYSDATALDAVHLSGDMTLPRYALY